MGEFGDKFRKAREKKELSFDDVSQVIKISARMLRAIEEEHFEQLPGGVFNRGFIRTYARQLGLNEDEAVADYVEHIRQEQIEAAKALEPAEAKDKSTHRVPGAEKLGSLISNRRAGKSSQLEVEELPGLHLPRAEHVRGSRRQFLLKPDREIPWGIVAIAAVAVILALILWIRHSHRAAPPKAAVVAASAPKSASTTAAGSANPVGPPAANPPGVPASRRPALAASVSHPPAAAPASGAATKIGTNPSPQKAPGPFTLVIRAAETSWISVEADGEIVRQETLIAPAHVAVNARREIVAKVGNAAGITFSWNGQVMPVNGAESEVKTVIFDANGMRTAAPAQAASAR